MTTAFVTMVYNDEFFLDVWLKYYLKYASPKDIYIVTHGPQPYAHEMGRGCNIIEIERDARNPRLDQDRFAYLSSFCSDLTKSYDRVIWNDVDEIILLDPRFGDDLIGYIEDIPKEQRVVTPLGLEIIHRPDIEGDYDYSRQMLAQRKYVRFNGWYTKPNITGIPIVWGPDGHGSSYDKIHLDDCLYTLHLKWFDQRFHINRHQDRLKLRFINDDGDEVIVGAGSWGWSQLTYLIETNRMLRMRVIPEDQEFDFSVQREKVVSTFRRVDSGMYRISWSADGFLFTLPERFIGMV